MRRVHRSTLWRSSQIKQQRRETQRQPLSTLRDTPANSRQQTPALASWKNMGMPISPFCISHYQKSGWRQGPGHLDNCPDENCSRAATKIYRNIRFGCGVSPPWRQPESSLCCSKMINQSIHIVYIIERFGLIDLFIPFNDIETAISCSSKYAI